jgi:hypothetical protein
LDLALFPEVLGVIEFGNEGCFANSVDDNSAAFIYYVNPIEKMWSKVKKFLRPANARTLDVLIKAIANALETVSCQDASAWFNSGGYRA